MGTRSLTFIYEDNLPVVNMYRQFDGYPSGHGADLAKFLASAPVVDGLGSDQQAAFNGMACLAAQMVGHFKAGKPGGIYLFHPDTRDCWQEYEYHVSYLADSGFFIRVACEGNGDILFEGDLKQFTAWCEEN